MLLGIRLADIESQLVAATETCPWEAMTVGSVGRKGEQLEQFWTLLMAPGVSVLAPPKEKRNWFSCEFPLRPLAQGAPSNKTCIYIYSE